LDALKEGISKGQEMGYAVLIVMGDLNARIGALEDIPHIMTIEQDPAEPMANPLKGVYSYEGIPQQRVCQDNKNNERGQELISLCHDTGMVVLNGRLGDDKHKGALTFVPGTKKGFVGEHYGSTIDLACIGAKNGYTHTHTNVD
jgi:hypothetical protein